MILLLNFHFFKTGLGLKEAKNNQNANLHFVNLSIGDCHETTTQFLAMTKQTKFNLKRLLRNYYAVSRNDKADIFCNNNADIFAMTKQIFFCNDKAKKNLQKIK